MFKTIKKKWISILTLAVMLVSLLAGISLSGAAEDANTKHYYIANATQWNAAAAISTSGFWDNTVIHLTGDINFYKDEESAIAPKQFAQAFTGTLEGNGKAIKNVDLTTALFAGITGTVKDLYIDSTVTFSGSNTGILTSALSGTVQNVGVRAAITGSDVYAIAYSESGTVTGCFFSGTGASGLAKTGTVTYSVCDTTAYTTSSVACASIEEAAWVVNNTGGAYFTYGYSSINNDDLFRIGTARDHIIKTTINGTVSYNDPGDEIALDTVTDKTAVVTSGCAYINGSTLYLTGISDNQNEVVVEYQDAAAVAKAQGKAELQTLIDVYEDPIFIENRAYFTDAGWTNMQTWLGQAKEMISADTATGAEFDNKFEAGRSVSVVSDLGYVPARYYSLYQYFPSFADFSVSTKEDWMALVDASNIETMEVNQYTNWNFSRLNGKNIHLINDVDMGNTPMLPLCYGHSFAGTINGHGFTLKNININVESAFGSVGLVGIQAGTSVIQNLQIKGAITVSGNPIFNTNHVNSDHRHEGNRVGGIAGQSNKDSVIRKCLVDVDFSVEVAGNVGGVLGDTRSAAYVDGCIVLGEVGGLGIVGEGANLCKVYNSIYGGSSGIIKYHKNIMGNVSESLTEFINNCYSFKAPIVWRGSWASWDESTDATVDAFTDTYQCGSILEAAYNANKNYVSSGKGDGERIYFTLDENGNLTFGTAENQIIKITVNDRNGNGIGTHYAPSTGAINLTHEMGRNYYALVDNETASYIRGQILYTKNAGDLTLKTATDIQSGNAYGATDAITIADAQMVLRKVVFPSETTLNDDLAGDVNFDGTLGADDAVLLVRYWLGDKTGYDKDDHLITSKDGWYTVVSYNVKSLDWDGGVEGGNGYHSKATTGTTDHTGMLLAEEVAAVIKSVGNVDLLGLQEIRQTIPASLHLICGNECYSNMDTLASNLGGSWNSSFIWASKSTGKAHSVEYGTGVMTPHTIGTTTQGEYKNQYGVYSDEKPERRTYGRFVVTMNDGTEIIWYNTHLGNVVEAQFAELAALMEADYDAGKYVVVTADFNMWPTSMAEYLDPDKFTMANGGTEGSTFFGTSADSGNPIDNIIVSNNLEFYWEEGRRSALNVVTYDDVSDEIKTELGCDEQTDWASDHNLVYAYIRVKPTQS